MCYTLLAYYLIDFQLKVNDWLGKYSEVAVIESFQHYRHIVDLNYQLNSGKQMLCADGTANDVLIN